MYYPTDRYNEPITVGVEDSNKFKLLEDYSYEWVYRGERRRIRVEAGFVFDGASIPWIVQPLTGGKWGLGKAPALLHDLIYQCGGRIELSEFGYYEILKWDAEKSESVWVELIDDWTREDADRLFEWMMWEAGIPKRRRSAAHKAVRWFGGGSWIKNPENKKPMPPELTGKVENPSRFE